MEYIAKAFIRVSNSIACEKDIQKIGDELFSKYLIAINSQKNGNLIVIDEGELWVYNEDTGFELCEKVKNEFIDCNFYTNGDEDLAVDLFLELAQMRDECYKGQWIWHQCNETGEITKLHKSNGKYVTYCFKYATPLELAEAVQSGAITKEQLTNK